MIASPHTISGDERLCRLYAFADEVLATCDALGIEPVLDGSLAVRAYTQHSAGTTCELRDWHVLQARRDDLKVEFGATEVWMHGITGPSEALRIGNRAVRMVNREALRELYQRGFDATQDVASQRVKHEERAAKLRALDAALREGG